MMAVGRSVLVIAVVCILAGAAWLAYLHLYPFRPQGLMDNRTWVSPDETLVASELVDDHDHGLGSPPWFGIAISPKDSDPLAGKVVVFGGDFRVHWNAADQLDIVPYCDGWIEGAKNRIEVSGRTIAIHIAPMSRCLHTPTS
jgi:hypothetical protein